MYCKTATTLATIALMAAAFAHAAAPAKSEARSLAAPASAIVNISVSFDMQMPLASEEMAKLSDAQIRGRKLIYRQAVSECPVLLETIAASCRLTRLNVSTRVNRQNAHQQQVLHLNGNAQFAITLRDSG